MRPNSLAARLGALMGAAALILTGCGSAVGAGGPSGSRSGAAAAAAKGSVNIGYVNWAEDVAVTDLWQQLLTTRGYKVQTTEADAGAIFAGLDSGSVQVFMDSWLPHTHGSYLAKVQDQVSKLSSWYTSPTEEGFVVPDYVTDVTSIADLKTHAKEFGNTIVGIDAGAGEMKIAQQAIQTYGLPETLQTSSEAGMLAALSKAETAKTPIVVTLWSPHWAFAQWKLHYLKDPKAVFGPSDHIYTLVNNGFETQQPEVTKWLKAFTLDQTQLGSLEELINSHKGNAAAGVTQWIAAHQSLVNSWFQQ